MKKLLSLLLSSLLLLTALPACTPDDTPADTTAADPSVTDSLAVTDTPAETEPETEPLDPGTDPATLPVLRTYDNDHGALLSSFGEQPIETYEAVCAYYIANGWTLYGDNENSGNRFSTYVSGEKLAHVYWIRATGELKLVTSDTEGATLPPIEPATGDKPTTVTQLQQNSGETSGMAYIIRLADGSFIVYDGGYASTIKELLGELQEQNGPGEVHIRAWIMSHSHDDHYSGFQALAKRLKPYLEMFDLTVKLDHFIMAPISDADALAIDSDGLFFAEQVDDSIAAFKGTKICYAHTGMKLRFCNLTVEFLLTGEDLFIDGSTGYFNDSSLIARIYNEQPDTKETLSMLFLGDAGQDVAARLVSYYGEALQSDMCQISHHGVENFPLSAYEVIAAPTLFYPCNNYLYALTDRDADVRAALRESEVTKEILLRDNDQYTRYLDPSLNPAPIGKPDASGKFAQP